MRPRDGPGGSVLKDQLPHEQMADAHLDYRQQAHHIEDCAFRLLAPTQGC